MLKELAQASQAISPRLDDNRILPAPFRPEPVKRNLADILRHGPIFGLQILHEFLLTLAPDILHRVAYLMDDAELDGGLGIHTLYCFGEAFQAIDAGYHDILHSAVLEVSKDT